MPPVSGRHSVRTKPFSFNIASICWGPGKFQYFGINNHRHLCFWSAIFRQVEAGHSNREITPMRRGMSVDELNSSMPNDPPGFNTR